MPPPPLLLVLRRLTPVVCCAVVLCHCGVPELPPCRDVPRASRVPAATLLATVRSEWARLGDRSQQSAWPAARQSYNAAVAKLFDQLRCGRGDWNTRAATLGTCIGPACPEQTDIAKLDGLFPADLVKPSDLHRRQTTAGLGVPLVGWRKTSAVGQPRPPFLLPNGLPYNVTAVLDCNRPGPPVWRFTKRWLQEDTPVGSHRQLLAADWTAANAFYWHMCQLDELKIQNVILPDRYVEETGIYFVEPYNPNKIPLVFVHGLVSSPDAFKNMINDLAPEPWFRQNYQIWLYNYPTGAPWIFSSMNFRAKMRQACAYARSQGDDRNLKRMVVVAHSMGGLLTRSSVTDPGHVFYDARFKRPLDQLKVPPNARQLIHDSFLYQPLTEPKRVVFLAVPHRGSPAANFRVSLWISRLIRLPKTLTVGLLDNTLLALGDAIQGEDPTQHLPTSINSLSPNNKSTLALNQLPLPRRVTFHSVIGDRGKGNGPQSSDGVVPYWSSHITPVASELIVPCNHSVPDNPAAARELARILQLHLRANSKQ